MKEPENIPFIEVFGSSRIRGYYYDEENQVLYLEFVGASYYSYQDVSEEEFKDFINSESLMKHFHKFIKQKKTEKL